MTYTTTTHPPAYAIESGGEIVALIDSPAEARELVDECDAAELLRLDRACGVGEVVNGPITRSL